MLLLLFMMSRVVEPMAFTSVVQGVIGPGGVQWMTAGRGIVHSEVRTGFAAEGCHGWRLSCLAGTHDRQPACCLGRSAGQQSCPVCSFALPACTQMPMTTGGDDLHGFQLWINLPKAHKMVKPRCGPAASGHLGSPIATRPSLRCCHLGGGQLMRQSAQVPVSIGVAGIRTTRQMTFQLWRRTA